MPSRRIFIGFALGACALASGMGHARAAVDPAKAFPQAAELARAIADGNGDQLRRLAQAGADLSVRGQEDFTLLQWAMLRDQPRMLELLLTLGANPAQLGFGRQTALHTATMAKKKPFLKILLDHGASPDMIDGHTGAPVLSEAIISRNPDATRLLLAHHADLNLTNRQGETPLHTAALVNDYSSMLALLEAGADPRRRDRLGKTFLAYFNIQPKEGLLSGEVRRARQRVRDWLGQHGYGDLAP